VRLWDIGQRYRTEGSATRGRFRPQSRSGLLLLSLVLPGVRQAATLQTERVYKGGLMRTHLEAEVAAKLT